MSDQIQHLASLSLLDLKQDELEEEYGDLPGKIDIQKAKFDSFRNIVEETQTILKEVKEFIKTARVQLSELKDKEEKLAKQQFLVRNNKEFDAITKEIDFTREEYNRLGNEMRTASLKEENILTVLVNQKKDMDESKNDLDELQEEFNDISSNQNEELKGLLAIRKKIVKKINKDYYKEYERIRFFHRDAVVRVSRNNCSGCYSQVPPQKIVEMRSNLEQLYFCENCGRIIYPEEVEIDTSMVKI